MIQSIIRMDIDPEKVDAALQILGSIVERTRAEAGCISCTVSLDIEDQNRIVFEETWSGQEALDRHLRSEEYQRVLLVMEMARVKPEIRFDIIATTSGVEIIEKARTKKR